ncbi:MAG: trypsin-like peptidase domain-containing protein [Pirellulales bacterium]
MSHDAMKLYNVGMIALALLVPAAARAQVDPAVLEAEKARVAVVERSSNSTVAIFARGGQGGGSGVVISPDGYALSNFHVTLEAGRAMQCGMADGNLYDAVIVGLDPTGDVALLKLLGRDDFPHAELGDSDRVRAGDWCFTVGNPFLLATDFRPTVAYGVISGVHRYQYPAGTILEYADCLQADAAINPGNSGGPMFDAEGRLIGINGRGSFEKRGRVNVGVGYAISINQIKNFLGHLKSGRIVDHATLGAVVRSDENRRVIVDDILEESDANRRGLRYGDEVVRFGGRSIGSVNALKNALGIYPRDWRVPLSFVHQGERYDVLVRLRGVHARAELEEMVEGRPRIEPGRPQPKPEGPPKRDDPPKKPERKPAGPPAPTPEIVKKHFIARPGYVNYYFNQLERDRVWRALVARGDYGDRGAVWTLEGETGIAEPFTLVVSDRDASIKLPAGQSRVELAGGLSNHLEPPASGGMLVALAMWRRMLVEGPEKFGDVYYLGTAPVVGHEGLLDVLAATHDDVECRFMFDPDDGYLVAMEMYPAEDVDPCELYFGDFKEIEGRMMPSHIEVRHADDFHFILECKQQRFEEKDEG